MKKYKNEQKLSAVVRIYVQRIKIRRVMFMNKNVLVMTYALFVATSALSVYADTTTTTNAIAETIATVAQELEQTAKRQTTQDFKNGKRPPEPPKDANGNPLPPPDRQGFNNVKNGADSQNFDVSKTDKKPPEPRDLKNGQRPPEPPKDAYGNPMKPPKGEFKAVNVTNTTK